LELAASEALEIKRMAAEDALQSKRMKHEEETQKLRASEFMKMAEIFLSIKK
jgi:hypothetical protein